MITWEYSDPDSWIGDGDYGKWRAYVAFRGVDLLRLDVYEGALGECVASVYSAAEWHVDLLCDYDECDDVEEAKRIAVMLAQEVLVTVADSLHT